MKFIRDTSYDQQFDTIEYLQWYPYVGSTFKTSNKHIMVFAHNIPVKKEKATELINKWRFKSYWADAIDEYTYEKGFWTETFRSFIKGATGLKSNYDARSSEETINKIDTFVNKISYINYIQEAVISDSNLAIASNDVIRKCKELNKNILEVLDITHCICWGKNVYRYIKETNDVDVINETDLGKKGFSMCDIRINDRIIKLLKVFHPSMPGFDKFSQSTHNIINSFLEN